MFLHLQKFLWTIKMLWLLSQPTSMSYSTLGTLNSTTSCGFVTTPKWLLPFLFLLLQLKLFSIKDAAQPNRTGSSYSLFSGENSDEHHPLTSSSTSSSIITAITSAAAPSTSISIKDNAQLNRSGSSNSHLSDENSKEHHPTPPASITSATIATTPISNPTKLSYSAKKRLARKKKKQAQLSWCSRITWAPGRIVGNLL